MRHAIPAILGLFLAGCVSTPPQNEVRRLMAFPGFEDAAKAAPGWTVEVLDSVARLEYEIHSAAK